MEHLSEIRSGSLIAFQSVYNLYHKKLYVFILKKTGSEYLAEEVVQLTFIRLWNKRRSLPSDFPVSVLLFRMAGTILIDQIRKEAVNKRLLAKVEFEDCADNSSEYKSTLAAFEHIIELMAPVRKKIFRLSRFEGYSHKEISEKLSISPKTVENHISKAIKQIKAAISSLLIVIIYTLLK